MPQTSTRVPNPIRSQVSPLVRLFRDLFYRADWDQELRPELAFPVPVIPGDRSDGYFTGTGNPKYLWEKTGWPITLPLLSWNYGLPKPDYWTLESACAGTIIFGGTGSGKTSGSGQVLARSLMRIGAGGLWLCCKADEFQTCLDMAIEEGRAEDVVVFRAEDVPGNDDGTFDYRGHRFNNGGRTFNFINYEMRRAGRGGGTTKSVAEIFIQCIELAQSQNGKGSGDDFWQDSARILLTTIFDLLKYSKKTLTIEAIYKVLVSAPDSLERVKQVEWQKSSVCYQWLQEAIHNVKEDGGSGSAEYDVERCRRYFLKEFAELADRTRSGVIATLNRILYAFDSTPLREVFCGGESGEEVTPDDILRDGKIVLIDIDPKSYQDSGKYCNLVWKYLTQLVVERRWTSLDAHLSGNRDMARPIFIWADEAQMFAVDYDQKFQTTARSAKCVTVYLTQSKSNFEAAMGGDAAGKARVDSLMGNLQTKIFHQNTEVATNEYTAKVFFETKKKMKNEGVSMNMGLNPLGWSRNSSEGMSEQWRHTIEPKTFTQLKTGGKANNLLVEGIISIKGNPFVENNQPYLLATFDQVLLRREEELIETLGKTTTRPLIPIARPVLPPHLRDTEEAYLWLKKLLASG